MSPNAAMLDLQATAPEALPSGREASVHSAHSDTTASSCIIVGGSRQLSSSTPSTTTRATSVSIDESLQESKLIVTRQRSPHRKGSPTIKNAPSKETSRALSGETLVESDAIRVSTPTKLKLEDSRTEKSLLDPREESGNRGQQRRVSKPRAARITEAAKATAGLLVAKASVLGKRGFAALETGSSRVGLLAGARKTLSRKNAHPDTRTKLKGTGDESERPTKRSRLTMHAPSGHGSKDDTGDHGPRNAFERYKGKLWLTSGLYVGQEQNFNPKTNHSGRKGNALPEPESEQGSRRMLPLPMFAGKRLLENGRGFRLPYDVCSPLPPGQSKPEEWRKTQKNVFVGDAATEWKHHKNLAHSPCLCTMENGCDETCQNRYMLYECDDLNCNLGKENCTNRAFADLKERMKSGNKYDIGVEVVKTAEKGFGVRSNRMFEAGQIIMEYAGEIITQDECERRMRQEYKNNECYYLMVFDQNMIIDATRGSIARFVNHSCDPNCRMVKWTVAGKPRMALFAGDAGVMTGEELTYDYNFDPFSQKNVQTCRCGAATCRGILGPRPPGGSAPKVPESLLAGTKRKILEAFPSLKPSTQLQPKSKKSRVEQQSVITVASAPPPPIVAVKVARQKPGWYWEPVKNTKKERIMSSKNGGSTLLDKDNIISGSRRRLTPSVSQVQTSKKGKLARTVSMKSRYSRPARALARVSLKVKRTAKVASL